MSPQVQGRSQEYDSVVGQAVDGGTQPEWLIWDILGIPLIVVIHCLSHAEKYGKNSPLRPCFAEFLTELLYSV